MRVYCYFLVAYIILYEAYRSLAPRAVARSRCDVDRIYGLSRRHPKPEHGYGDDKEVVGLQNIYIQCVLVLLVV